MGRDEAVAVCSETGLDIMEGRSEGMTGSSCAETIVLGESYTAFGDNKDGAIDYGSCNLEVSRFCLRAAAAAVAAQAEL